MRHITASKNFRKNEPNDIWKPEPSHDRKEFRRETSKRVNTDRAVEAASHPLGRHYYLLVVLLFLLTFSLFFFAKQFQLFFSSILPRVIQAVSPPSNQSHNSCCGVKSNHVTNLVKRGRGRVISFLESPSIFFIAKAFSAANAKANVPELARNRFQTSIKLSKQFYY